MYRKLVFLVSFVSALGLINSAWAQSGDCTWTGLDANDLWSTSTNWDVCSPPTSSERALNYGNGRMLIDSSVDAHCYNILMGGDGVGNNSILDMNGGSLTIHSGGFWAGESGSPGDAIINLSGGNLTIIEWGFSLGVHSSATLNMTGGTITCIGYPFAVNYFGELNSSGYANLDGGIIYAPDLWMNNKTNGPGENGHMDITGGTLILDGNDTATINGFISNGWLTGYYGSSGGAQVQYDGDANKTTVTATLGPRAWNPSPANDAEKTAPDVVVSWSQGAGANEHHVYFGTDFNDVNNGVAGVDKGLQSATNYDPCGLEFGQTCYWRIDEVNEPNTWKGKVWRFIVDDGTANAPSPGDSTEFMDPNTEISWSAGIFAAMHHVYFGTDFNDVNTGFASADKGLQSATNYDPCGLEFGQTYYWRIDEVNEPNTWKGKIWSFTTRTAPGTVQGRAEVRILSWNIEFLGARDPLRTQEQINAIAQRILTFDAAVLALQEITVVAVLEDIRSQLGLSWKIYHSGMENALLYDENKVEMLNVEILSNLANPPYTLYPGANHRKPVSGVFQPVSLYAEPFPFRVIGVHCHWSNSETRTAEGTWLKTRIIELLQDPDEPNDIILLGDLNGSPGQPPHPSLQEGNYLHLLPKENGEITHVNSSSRIDHCYVTQDANDKLPKQSAFIIRPQHYSETPAQFDETYSDHLPVFIDFKPAAYADMVDFAMFAAHWRQTGCNLQNNWCDRADLTGDHRVDMDDLNELVGNWLAGVE